MDSQDIKPKPPRRRDTNDVRAERKRELDRLAQRATRERTKNRIAFLEQKLASLESCDQESTISTLTKTIDDLRGDNMRLQSAMMKMRFAINEALDGTELIPTANTTCCTCKQAKCTCQSKHDSVSSSSSSNDDNTVEEDHPSTANSDANVPLQDGILGMWPGSSHMGGIEEFLGFQPNTLIPPVFDEPTSATTNSTAATSLLTSPWPPVLPTQPTLTPTPYNFLLPATTPGPLTIASDYEKWHVSNGAFTSAMSAIRTNLATNHTLDLHVPFRAALWGWDSIPHSELSHPVWAAIRSVDQKVFGSWRSKAARIAVMYACQTLMQYRETPSKENLARVPRYLLPRPSQQRIQHPAVIDYLVWPGLRDRLVFEHEKYTRTGEFSAAFVKYAHFDWPFGDDEIFVWDQARGEWSVNEVFLERVYDYRCWSMLPGFVEQFPEMRWDVNVWEGEVVGRPAPPPRAVSVSSSAGMGWSGVSMGGHGMPGGMGMGSGTTAVV